MTDAIHPQAAPDAARPRLSGWLLPPLLATIPLAVYFLLILPLHERPWHTPPPPKPGMSATFRSINITLRAADEAQAAASRKAAAERASRAASKPPASKPDTKPDTKPATKPATKLLGPTPEPTPADTATMALPEPALEPALEPADTRPRTPSESRDLWSRHGSETFAEEPVDAPWAAEHHDLVAQIARLTRDRVFAGAPDPASVDVGNVVCRSIRCELTLVGPYAHEVELLATAITALRRHHRPLWRTIERQPPARPGRRGSSGGNHELRLHLGLDPGIILSAPALGSLRLEGEPLVAAAP